MKKIFTIQRIIAWKMLCVLTAMFTIIGRIRILVLDEQGRDISFNSIRKSCEHIFMYMV